MAVNIQQALKEAVDKIEKTSVQTPLLDAEVLLCHVLKKDRLFLYTNRNYVFTDEQYSRFLELIQKRLMGMPVQYIINKQEFMGLDFYVEEGVLIPRPDTEILVETVIEWAKNIKNDRINVVDIGTGSGAITVSIAKYIPNSFVYGVDISKKALKIAKKNAASNHASNISFLEGDLFEPLRKEKLEGRIDILVSNPPYIPKNEIEKLQIEVSKYEPKLALDGGIDGLDYYRRIIDEASCFLRNDGLIALEVGHDQAEAVKNMMERKRCYKNIKKIKDLAGIERVVTGIMNNS
ncbi:peptide chain release factor N(5)-glutamine methyltransferase [Crassaminicella thermophila]|uniref:Release factor glutamine methyltransferase n=1 Tax=Crassaminicella thermophila TaxID=2599308 RepID=A0A5C0SFV7_CRATE|nr:peptide chain release factor N(5)-glutamine methyltransferase [Crassaminicella thermophila]QEK13241.1 peptide chain release factor N(5)-glutamine methyltransferase [Crassaminicella thermophila]